MVPKTHHFRNDSCKDLDLALINVFRLIFSVIFSVIFMVILLGLFLDRVVCIVFHLLLKIAIDSLIKKLNKLLKGNNFCLTVQQEVTEFKC